MTAITTREEIINRQLQGRGVNMPFVTTANGTLTAAAAGSGFFPNSLHWNLIGTTLTTTLVGMQLPPGTQDLRCTSVKAALPVAKSGWLGWLYRFGTFNLNSTSATWAHDSTFTELRRTQFGEASSPITMIPLVYFIVGGGSQAGVFTTNYTDQDGNATTGTVNFTTPATNTAIQSCFTIMLNDNDCAVRDVTNVVVGTQSNLGSTHTIGVFGFEHVATVHSTVLGELSYDDQVYSPTLLKSLRPAVPDSGSVTSALTFLCPGNLGTVGGNFVISGVDNT